MSSFITTLSDGANCKFTQLLDFQISVWVYTPNYKQEGLHRDLKMTHIDFAILNNDVTVIYLRFIKSTNFRVVKPKFKIAVFFSAIFLVYKMCLF